MPSRRLSPRIRKGDRPLPQRIAVILLATALLAPSPPAPAQGRVTTPREALGFDIGADYHLATYTQLEAYWHTLARQSPRMVLREIGKTAEGRTQLMAIITAPENHKRIARYQEIARRLAHAEGLTDEQAHALAAEGKAVVWIDGGLHATEVLGAHQLMELVYQMVSRDDPETRRFLNDVILLAVHANPDGMELVSSWYMREPDSLKRSTAGIPRLYQKYIGHDNNRDFYMVNQPETENMARVMFREWFPQIVYNHHQTGPAGAVLFAPPFRDPFNYYFDPLVPIGIDMVAAAMHDRFLVEGKPGATMRSAAPYSTWWNGGLRTTAYFHNIIGLLTESIGNPTPIDIPFVPDRELPKGDLPSPVQPQRWHFRQSVEYSITANRAVLDYASRYRETLLYNIYRMGKNAIERGSTDHWTMHPQLIETVKAAATKDSALDTIRTARTRDGRRPIKYFAMLRDPALRLRGGTLPWRRPAARRARQHRGQRRRVPAESPGERRGDRDQSAAGEGAGGRPARAGDPGKRQDLPRRHDLHSRHDSERPPRPAARDRAGRELRGCHEPAHGRGAAAAARADRPVGPLRRVDPFRLDALAARAIRVLLRGGVPADPRRWQALRAIRCARVPRRRGSAERPRPGGGLLRATAGARDDSRRVPRPARPRDRAEDRAPAPAVSR